MMKKLQFKHLLSLAVMILFLIGGDLRGQTIELGTDASTNYNLPLSCSYKYSATEQIYTASEITNAEGYTGGQIKKIYFYCKASSDVSRKIDIYIGQTTKSSFTANNDWIPALSTNLRYSSGGESVTFPSNSWKEITLDTPFEYDGTSNIVVIVDDNSGSAISSTSFSAYSASNAAVYRNYSTDVNPSTNTDYLSATNKNHIKLTFETVTYPKPINTTASDITNSTATISWTSPTATVGHTLEGYQYKYYNTYNYAWSSTTIEEGNSCDIGSLFGGTNYTFVVRAIYTDSSKETHYSDWAEVSFKTDCDDLEVFESVSWGFEGSSTLPDCWKITESHTISTTTYPSIIKSQTYSHNSSYCIQFKGNYDEVVLMPAIEGGLNGNKIEFYAKASSQYNTYHIAIGYYDTNNDFVSIKDDFTITSTYPEDAFYVEFNGLPNYVKKVAIKGSTGSDYYMLYLDDVSIVATSSCTPVSSPSYGTVNYNSARLSWTAVGSETNWKLQYRESGAESWNTEEISSEDLDDGVYTLTGLSENTTYEWRVAAWCDTSDDDDISTYEDGDPFTTPEQYPMPTGLEADNITSNSADISWTAGSSETAWQLYYTNNSALTPEDAAPGEIKDVSTTPEYSMTGLTRNTTYYVYVRANYGSDHYSSWAYEYFTTECGTFALPYTYNFEDPLDLDCWTMRNTYPGSAYYDPTGISSTAYYSASNSFKFQCTTGTYATQYLISPELSGTACGVMTKLYHKQESTGATIQIGYSSTDNDTESFEWGAATENKVYSSFTEFEFYCPANTKYVAIRLNSSTYMPLYIDDISFTTFDKVSDGDYWYNTRDWNPVGVPSASDNIYINRSMTIRDKVIATANNIKIGPSGSLTIENGGELILSNSNTDVEATVKKTVTASSSSKTATNNWYAISSPTHDDNKYYESFSNVSNLTPAAPDYLYNVYRYDEYSVVWQEHRDNNNKFNTMKKGRGYLFRSTKGGDLEYSGVVNTDTVKYNLSWSCPTEKFKGFNLIGNPYTHTIYKGAEGSAIPNGSILEDKYYTIGTNGRLTLTADGTAIAPGQAIFVQAKSASTLTMNNSTSGKVRDKYANDNIWFMVKNAESSDLACVEFRKGHGLNKVEHRNDITPMLYIMHNGENFASADMSDNTSVINLGFEAKTTGEYTFSLKATGTYSYMHLIDKITGADVDMLIEDSYSFVGSPRDHKDRFELRLNYNAANIDSESDIFAYQNGADIIVRGEGELQVFDVTGRMAMKRQINGVQTVNGLNNGVYIFRLVGTEVKTQKIVVR